MEEKTMQLQVFYEKRNSVLSRCRTVNDVLHKGLTPEIGKTLATLICRIAEDFTGLVNTEQDLLKSEPALLPAGPEFSVEQFCKNTDRLLQKFLVYAAAYNSVDKILSNQRKFPAVTYFLMQMLEDHLKLSAEFDQKIRQ
ncbi:MAG: hypothetical protein LKF96_05430 [Treponema sp.]|nr:hypothetical protein [Treponema sp.]